MPYFYRSLEKFIDLATGLSQNLDASKPLPIDFGALRILLKHPECLSQCDKTSGNSNNFTAMMFEIDEIELESIPTGDAEID